MHFTLAPKPRLRRVGLLLAVCLTGVGLFWTGVGDTWVPWDFQLHDVFYKQALRWGFRAAPSSRLVYVTITDETYKKSGKNFLDRADMARLNEALHQYSPQAVAYDIIFARPSTAQADEQFAASLAHLGNVYLPIGIAYSDTPRPFVWAPGVAYERLRTEYLQTPHELGAPRPLYATHALMQMDAFAAAVLNAGHISIASDSDGVYRHLPMLFKVDTQYLPTLAMAMFLDDVQVPFQAVTVAWGQQIVIPALPGSLLERDVVVPIDASGRAFIPYVDTWERDFEKMAVHTFLDYHRNPDLQGNLADFFEGKFVFVADISTGASDLGQTPLEDDVPLVVVHTAMLNGLLTRTFYSKWSFWNAIGAICLFSLPLGLAAIGQKPWMLYAAGGLVLAGTVGLTWVQFLHFSLVPACTIGGSLFAIWAGFVMELQISISKQQAFIRGAFSKYVPEEVVRELLLHPERLQLGGEERQLSVLFSDIEGFTTIAERMSPSELVTLLNAYLSAMTAIVLAQGGIIDKFEGDAIMAEFGAPLARPDHADMAVQTGLAMQRHLHELRQVWVRQGWPVIRCRVGISTGVMLLGNMGSDQVFDYTVIGDTVNLASRLEEANKRYQTSIIISESTYNHLSPERFRTRFLDIVQVKGKTQAVKVFEVYGTREDDLSPESTAYYAAYETALHAYLSRHFTDAKAHFDRALALRPDDPAALAILHRISELEPDHLPDDWDGSIALTTK